MRGRSLLEPFLSDGLRKNWMHIVAGTALVGATALGMAADNAPRRTSDEYIKERFLAAIGESPKLAWVLDDGTVAAEGTFPAITVYSWKAVVTVVNRHSTVLPADVPNFARKHRVACDAAYAQNPAELSLYEPAPKRRSQNPLAFWTRRPLPTLRAGFQPTSPSESAVREVWARLGADFSGSLRKSFSIGRSGVPFFYTFAGVYEGTERAMSQQGIFLHAEDGTVIAARITEVKEDELCDGCAMPTFADPLEQEFRVVNMLTARQFAYPLLMLDTSTVEGRALSLATFSPAGDYDEFRLYEYVLGCFGSD